MSRSPRNQGDSTRFSDWQSLPTRVALTPATLAETLDGGQSFRWQQREDLWSGTWTESLVELRLHGGLLEWRAPISLQKNVATSLPRYLALETDWPALTDSLPWRSDAHLAQCIAAFPGLSLLRQPFGETLLGFLCSATKQIVQIKQMVALLAKNHGAPISPDTFRLPTWAEIAEVTEKDLRACLLGFRARYIHQTALFLAQRPGWLEETEQMPYLAAKARLMELPGVGEKVADCVLLFGAGKLEAFPVDTWVLKSLARRYGLNDWKPAQVAHFGRTHFGPLAGLAQQYLFAWERRHGGR
ncbi:DNA-3-methyladenine glycosylase family protein [Oleiharenicola lentus]|uniref:DNA-3-methyladenine glycosylase family protein n=1 Tax=Oleiharenicola lentus TaxID=2508720 RepID=UPI003F67F8CE